MGESQHVVLRPQNQFDGWINIFMSNDVLRFVLSDHVTGISKSGKNFSRFQGRESLILSWRSGRLRVYLKTNARRMAHRSIPSTFRDITANPSGTILYDSRITPYLLERSPLHYGPARTTNAQIWQQIAYPMVREVPNWVPITGVSKGLREHSVQDMTMTLFSKKRYRKDLVKAIAGTKNLEAVKWAYELKRLVPVDWMIPLISESRQLGSANPVELFGAIGEPARKRLLLSAGDGNEWMLRDTIAAWKYIKRIDPMRKLDDYRVTDWTNLHDHLAREQGRITRPNEKIPQKKLVKGIDGVTDGEISIVSAKETWQLIDWGNSMNNCIGGYDQRAVNGSSLLFAVMRGDEMIGNIELSPSGTVRQLLGKHNSRFQGQERVLAMLPQLDTEHQKP